MASLSRMATKCRDCPFVSKCEKKRMEAAAFIEPNLTMPATTPSVAEMVSPMAVKHDYRNVKVAENRRTPQPHSGILLRAGRTVREGLAFLSREVPLMVSLKSCNARTDKKLNSREIRQIQ